ncbi:MAG: hypothetical protein JWN48_2923 [Myxococcaceae bacterium]|nr:hypothetical protein [Myxococcaceae bacterium]
MTRMQMNFAQMASKREPTATMCASAYLRAPARPDPKNRLGSDLWQEGVR